MRDETLLDRSKKNFILANSILKESYIDDFYLNATGYFLQQSVELYLKHYLEQNGVKYEYTHDIRVLLSQCKNNNINLDIKEDVYKNLYMMSGTITNWESKTRYIKNYFLEREEIECALVILNKIFLEDETNSINILKNKLDEL